METREGEFELGGLVTLELRKEDNIIIHHGGKIAEQIFNS
jgi:hypothetical protein